VAAGRVGRAGGGGVVCVVAVIAAFGGRAGLGVGGVVSAVVGGGRHVKAPGRSKLHGFVGAAAIDDRGNGINDVDRLAALGAVAEIGRGRVGKGGVEGRAAVTGAVGHGADDREGGAGASVGG